MLTTTTIIDDSIPVVIFDDPLFDELQYLMGCLYDFSKCLSIYILYIVSAAVSMTITYYTIKALIHFIRYYIWNPIRFVMSVIYFVYYRTYYQSQKQSRRHHHVLFIVAESLHMLYLSVVVEHENLVRHLIGSIITSGNSIDDDDDDDDDNDEDDDHDFNLLFSEEFIESVIRVNPKGCKQFFLDVLQNPNSLFSSSTSLSEAGNSHNDDDDDIMFDWFQTFTSILLDTYPEVARMKEGKALYYYPLALVFYMMANKNNGDNAGRRFPLSPANFETLITANPEAAGQGVLLRYHGANTTFELLPIQIALLDVNNIELRQKVPSEVYTSLLRSTPRIETFALLRYQICNAVTRGDQIDMVCPNSIIEAIHTVYPFAAHEMMDGRLPIHRVLEFPDVTKEVIETMVVAYPESVNIPTEHDQQLPIHIACEHGLPVDIIMVLIRASSSSLMKRDGHGRLPIHLASMRLRQQQQQQQEDKGGNGSFVLTNLIAVVGALTQAAPQALLIPSSCINNNVPNGIDDDTTTNAAASAAANNNNNNMIHDNLMIRVDDIHSQSHATAA